MKGLILEVDGCYVDSKGVQHYTYPREADEETNAKTLALYEYVWHLNPDWQGQVSEGDTEVECNWGLIEEAVGNLQLAGKTKVLFPRQTFLDYLGNGHDALAYCEYRWYTIQG